MMADGDQHAELGLTAFESGDFLLAIRELQMALALELLNFDATGLHTALGQAYETVDNSQEALYAYKQALDINPRFYPAWNGLGLNFFYSTNLKKAEECYKRALRLQPDDAAAYINWAALQLYCGAPEEAMQLLEKANRLAPRDPKLRAFLALACAMTGNFSRAEVILPVARATGYHYGQTVQAQIAELKQLRQRKRQQTFDVDMSWITSRQAHFRPIAPNHISIPGPSYPLVIVHVDIKAQTAEFHLHQPDTLSWFEWLNHPSTQEFGLTDYGVYDDECLCYVRKDSSLHWYAYKVREGGRVWKQYIGKSTAVTVKTLVMVAKTLQFEELQEILTRYRG